MIGKVLSTMPPEEKPATPAIDILWIYNENVARLQANGEEDANRQAAEAVGLIVELEDKIAPQNT